jgi:DDE superfamily endonuclease
MTTNGTGHDLFAALTLATGQPVYQTRPQHRAIEFRRFLDAIDDAVPEHLEVHVVLDNSSTHKTPAIHKAAAPPAVHLSLHAHQLVVVEPRRAPVRRAHPPALATIRAPDRRRAHRRPRQLDRHRERRPKAVRLVQDRRSDPRPRQEILNEPMTQNTSVGARKLPHRRHPPPGTSSRIAVASTRRSVSNSSPSIARARSDGTAHAANKAPPTARSATTISPTRMLLTKA